MSVVNRIVRLGIGPSTCKGSGGASSGRFRLQKHSVRRVAAIAAGLADDSSGLESLTTDPKTIKSSDNTYVPLPGLWLSVGRLRCRRLLQFVASCCRCLLTAEAVADCSQTVAIRLQKAKICVFGVPMSMRHSLHR